MRHRFSLWWILPLLLLVLSACNMGAQSTGNVATTAPKAVQPSQQAPAGAAAPSPTAMPTMPPTAVVVPQPTAAAEQPTAAPTPATGAIIGTVWLDDCPPPEQQAANRCQDYQNGVQVGDGKRQADEVAVSGIVVNLAKGGCPGTPFTITATDSNGAYRFSNLEPGTYCVSVDIDAPANAPLLRPGVWTAPGIDTGYAVVNITGGSTTEVNFGRTRLAEAAAAPTQPAPTAAPTAATTETAAAPSPTPTVQQVTSPAQLGDPDVVDPMDVPAQHWYLNATSAYKYASTGDGKLLMEVEHPGESNYWLFSNYPELKDGYVEAVFITGPKCVAKDRYGLLVRAPTHYEGIQFLVSCDAFYEIVRWNGGMKVYQYWERTTAVHPGPRQVNRLGVLMQGRTLKFYINRELVAEVEVDNEFFMKGNVGLIIGAQRTAGFQVLVDQFAYWELP